MEDRILQNQKTVYCTFIKIKKECVILLTLASVSFIFKTDYFKENVISKTIIEE